MGATRTHRLRQIVIFDCSSSDSRSYHQSLKNIAGHEVICTDEPLNEETAVRYKEAHIVSVFVSSEVNAAVLKQMPGLELIAARSTGYDHIDITSARRHHTLVATVPDYGEQTVAEYVFLLLLAIARHYPASVQQLENGTIEYAELTGFDLAGKTLGLLGCGRIGTQTAVIARGFGMKVIGYDQYPGTAADITYVSFETVIETSDVISLHLPETKATHHMINAKRLAQMKPGVIIINTARGGLIDTKALVDALYSGQVGGAGLDVIEGEELLRADDEISLLHPQAKTRDLVYKAEQSILLRMPNVIMTPHNAFNSREAIARIRTTTVENIKAFLRHDPRNIVPHT